MKQRLFLLISLFFLLTSCNGSSGGTTTEAPPPVIPVVIPPPLTGQFNMIQSSFKILNSSNIEVATAGVGESLKLQLIAKDQYGNLMSGLNIKFVRLNTILPDIVPVEVSQGRYEYTVSFSDQSNEEFSVLKDSSSVNLNKNILVSYCYGSPLVSASPFHTMAIQSSDTYYVICNATQLSQVKNYLTRNFILGSNINLAPFYVDANSDNVPENQFKIGSDVSSYSGKFKGYNFSIQNFKYFSATENNVGLFAKISSGSVIDGITLDSPQVSGVNNVGSLAGSVEATGASPITISNNYLLGSIISSKSGDNNGGFIGLIDGTLGPITISNNSSSSTIDLNSSLTNRNKIGGNIGYAKSAIITQNYFSAVLTYTDKAIIATDIGGIVGKLENISTFSNNYSNAYLEINEGINVGGFIGSVLNSYISDTTNISIDLNLTGSLNGNFVQLGGLFGIIDTSSLMSISSYITSTEILDSFGGIANKIINSTSTKVILNGAMIGNADNIGGMYSVVSNSTLDRNWNYSSLTINGNRSVIGGISALLEDGSIVRRSNFEGSINAINSSIIGGISAMVLDSITIENSAVRGPITAGSSISGIIHEIDTLMNPASEITISNSYVSSTLTGNDYVSGFVGSLTNLSSISDSFSTAMIKTSGNVLPPNYSAIVLDKQSVGSTINQTFHLSSRTGVVSCLGLGCGSNTSITNTNTNSASDINYYYSSLSTPISSWNFSTIWNSFGSYPVLKY